MWNLLKNAWKVTEVRKKLIFTFFMLVVIRFGSVLPIPGVNTAYFDTLLSNLSGTDAFGWFNAMTGGSFTDLSVFALSITPYITSSIIMQLLTIAIPALEQMQKDGADGRKKIAEYTRYLTVALALIESLAMGIGFGGRGLLYEFNVWNVVICVVTMTAGSALLMWIGERITERGVGNGISLLIFAGIVARIPSASYQMVRSIQLGILNPVSLIVVVVMFFFVVALVVYEEKGQRKIPVQYSRRVVGRRMYGSQSSYIPFKINPSGVIPVIFASTLLSFPLQLGYNSNIGWLRAIAEFLDPQGAAYLIIYTLLIIAFAFFYTQVSLNPIEMAKNIRDNGGSIPGVRNEKLEEYLTKVLNRIVLPGAIFLAFIALIPTLIQMFFNFPASVAMLFGGTSLIILVGVDLETMRQLDAMMKMHHHDGFVDAKKRRLKKF